MSLIYVDVKSREPIYEQLIANIKNLTFKGLLAPDEQLPSVRVLARELAINPNTIQKAYTELERQGIIYSLPGRGNFISSNTDEIGRLRREKILSEIKTDIKKARDSGILQDDVLALVNEIWGDNND